MNNEIFDVIHTYTRRQAIEDGFLVDVSETKEARECGFKFPLAMTRAVWDTYVEVPEGVSCQDLKGRLWDVLWMLRMAIRKNADNEQIFFELFVRNDNRRPRRVRLKALCHGGDNAEPVITISLPEED